MTDRPNDSSTGSEERHHDIHQLANALEEVLQSWGGDAKEEASIAHHKARTLLKEIRARLPGDIPVPQTARDIATRTHHYVHDKPWQSVGIAVACGVFIGALLNTRR